jgi:hypothetical protein
VTVIPDIDGVGVARPRIAARMSAAVADGFIDL